MFSESFLKVLIVLALVWTALGAITLLTLLFRDFRNRNLW